MKKILVQSIKFEKGEDGPQIVAGLNNGHALIISKPDPWCYAVRTDSPAGRISETEEDVASLIYGACLSYLVGDEPESMSYAECNMCDALAVERIDWSALGYADGTDDEKALELSYHISNYMDL